MPFIRCAPDSGGSLLRAEDYRRWQVGLGGCEINPLTLVVGGRGSYLLR